MPKSRTFSSSTVTFDDRYLPVMLMFWEGKADVESAQWGMDVQNECAEELVAAGHKYVSISDATRADRPDAAVRKFWADTLSQVDPRHKAATLATFVVMESALMRGAMTAIGWVSPEARSIRSTPSLADSIREALELLDAEGIERPVGLSPESYAPPTKQEHSSESA